MPGKIRLQKLPRFASRWLFLATLIYAPFAYGGAPPGSIAVINTLLGTVLALWLIDMLLAGRQPEMPMVAAVAAALLLGIGWLMTINAGSVYDLFTHNFIPLQRTMPLAFSSVDKVLSWEWMIRATVLLGCLFYVADLSLRPVWLLRMWSCIGIAGGSMALLGLLQKASGAEMIFWQSSPWKVSTFFATYYYHANAGAYLNLVFAPTAALAWRAFHKRNARLEQALWMTATLLLLAAIFSNTSRVSQLIGAIVIVALAAKLAVSFRRVAVVADRPTVAVGVIIAGVALYSIAQASHVDRLVERWLQLESQLPIDARWIAAECAIRALPDAGMFGFGPGTFPAVFRHYQALAPHPLEGTWQFLHQDYIQTLVEWGWFGSGMWAVLFFGGVLVGIQSIRRLPRRFVPQRWAQLLPMTIIALATITLHALVDFPLQIFSLQLYVATYLGICWGSRQMLAKIDSARADQIDGAK